MEENEVKDENIPNWARYSGFEENTTGDVDGAVEDNNAINDLGQMLRDIKENWESEKEVQRDALDVSLLNAWALFKRAVGKVITILDSSTPTKLTRNDHQV